MHSNVHSPFSSERVTQREKGGDQGRMEDEKNKDWPENDYQLEKGLGAFNGLSYPMERIVSSANRGIPFERSENATLEALGMTQRPDEDLNRLRWRYTVAIPNRDESPKSPNHEPD